MWLFNCRFTNGSHLRSPWKKIAHTVCGRKIHSVERLFTCWWNCSYTREQDLEDILRSFKLDVRIVGDEYRKRISQDARTVRKRDWIVLYNGRDHRFSSSSCVKKLLTKKNKGISLIVCRWSITDYRSPLTEFRKRKVHVFSTNNEHRTND
jgi:hypothetical protein